MNKNLLLIAIVLLISFSCKKDEKEKDTPPVPSIEVITSNATVSTSGGVTFQGTYHSEKDPLTEIGFEYAKDSLFQVGKAVIKLQPDKQNTIEYFLATGIQSNVKYYFRAYIKVSGELYYGSVLSFISSGSKAPQIDSISSQYGFIADTISLYGKFFRDNNYMTKVDFSTTPAQIIVLQDTLIKCIIPADIKTVVSTINVKIDNRTCSFSSFNLFKPTVESISPLTATFRDEIVIKGKNFDINKSRNKAYIGNAEALITYADRNTLKAIVPDNLAKSLAPVKVKAQVQEVFSSENFMLKPPQIILVPTDIRAGQVIEIKGAYFHPVKEKNKVTFENVQATINSGDTRNLNTTVPYGPFPRRKAKFKVQVADLIVEHEVDLAVTDKWVMVNNTLPFSYCRVINNAVVVNNQAFIITHSLDFLDTKVYLWKLNATNFTWTKMEIPFALPHRGTATTDGKKIYVYTGTDANNFWAYDPLTNHWEQKNSFPGKRRDGSTHFSLNGDIYVGLGVDYLQSPSVIKNDFYKYSPTTNTWTRMADFTHEPFQSRSETAIFTINNIAYFGHGSSSAYEKAFWSYHPTTDKWIKIADCPRAAHFTSGFELGGYGYITGIGTWSWRYNPEHDIWEDSHDIIRPRQCHFTFTLNGKAYIGGGESTLDYIDPVTYELFELIP